MPSRRSLPAGLGDHPFPHGQRGEPPRLQILSQLGEERLRTVGDVDRRDAVHARRPLALCYP